MTFQKNNNINDILESAGLSSPIPENVAEYALERHTKIKKACEDYDRYGIKVASESKIQPFLEGWMGFCEIFEPEWTHIEHKVFCEKYRYMSVIDRYGKLKGKDKPVLVSIFPSTKLKKDAIKTAIAAYAMTGNDSCERLGVYIKEGKFKSVPYTDPIDFNIFLCAMTIHNYLKRRG